MKILLVEDEPGIAAPIVRALRIQKYEVRHAATLRAARAALAEAEPDLLLLDVRLPDHPDGGLTLAREARGANFRGRILMLTARDALDDRVNGLDGGADDYLVKPFDLPELLARVRALLRRGGAVTGRRFSQGVLALDFAARTVHWGGVSVALSNREFALLEQLTLAGERVFSPEELLDGVWGESATSLSVVKVFVHQLRQKLGPDVVQTVSGHGYRLGLCRGRSA